MASFYYAQNGQQLGPVSFQQLQQLANAGKLNPSDLLWQEGAPQWLPASSYQGLFASPPPTYFAPPMPPAFPTPPQPATTPPQFPPPQTAFPQQTPNLYNPLPYNRQPVSGKSIAALVLGIVSLNLWFGILTGTLAIIFAAVSLKEMNSTANHRGRGMAIAGLVMGIIGICIGLSVIFAWRHRYGYR